MYVSDSIRYSNEVNQKVLMREIDKSRNYFASANKIDPENWAVLSNLGSLALRRTKLEYVRRGDWEKYYNQTTSKFNSVLAVRPNYDFAYYELGKLNRMVEKFEKAVAYFRKSIDAEVDGRNVPTKSKLNQIIKSEAKDSDFF